MNRVLSTEATILLALESIRGGAFVFHCGVVTLSTSATRQCDDFSHNELSTFLAFTLRLPTHKSLSIINCEESDQSAYPHAELEQNTKLTTGIEPVTSSLPRKCSTA
jgi:hypothetical protein